MLPEPPRGKAEPVDLGRLWLGALLGLACAAPQVNAPSTAMTQAPPPLDAGPTASTPEAAAPPLARAEALRETLFGREVEDPYRWLEDERAPEVQAWMKAQDARTRAHLRGLPGREALQRRYAELYYLDQYGLPLKRGGRLFYSRQLKDKEKSVVFVRERAGAERVLLDPNGWSADNTVSLGTWVPSWDGAKVVYARKPNAADEATLYVLDVASGQTSEVDVITGAKYASPSWTPDGSAFYYEWIPEVPAEQVADRPGKCELRKHVLGTPPSSDVQVHPSTGDPRTFLGGGLSRDGQYLLVSIARGWNENDVYFREEGRSKAWRLLVKGKDARYEVAVWRGRFYVLTDEGAPNKRVFVVDPARPERSAWRELVKEDPKTARDSLSVVGGRLALAGLRRAVSVVELYDLQGRLERTLSLPGLGTATNLSGLEDDDEAYFAFSSFVQPRQVFQASVKTGAAKVWATVEVPVDPTAYQVRQVEYPSKDGTPISLFLVARKDVVQDGDNPVLLYGYGGFDISLTSSFNSFIYPWLEAGGVYAVPNLRGGGEYGKAWHDAGKGAHKQNVFDDFAAAAEYLVRERWTRPERLAIRGGSNGGLLVGAAMTQRPELFGAVICAVPLLDMLRYHRFGSGKTWIPEYGDPEVAADFAVLAGYSPYHRVVPGHRYPPLLMMSADHDDRVDPFHARKFVALLQGRARGASWLRIEPNAGHGGADQVARAIESSVDQLVFLFDALKLRG